jgi:hypothetical protein
MRRAIFALLALVVIGSSSGCCCLDRLFCWGCRGPCAYGNEGPCGACGYGGSGCGCSDCGNAGGGVAGGGQYGGAPGGGGGQYAGVAGGGPSNMMVNGRPANYRPAQGHPYVKQRRDSDDEYEFAAGPPSGSTTYPYYTNRGPRDFLARNPRSIGP